ncbi:MAG: type II toxin-antitoxin system VapC family toxin [Patescibacteria group bacterium]
MNYLLDTSVLIDLLRIKPGAEKFIDEHIKEAITTSTICEAEVYEGIYREHPERIAKKKDEFHNLLEKFFAVVAFDPEQADIAGRIRAELAARGSLIGDLDILIAAAAISQNATLVTKNPKRFQQIPGLQMASL